MTYPPYDYFARRDITVGYAVGYRPGDGLYAQVVNDLGLVLGVDVDAARADLMERPKDTATREAWINYVLTQEQGVAREELDDLGRAALIKRADGVEEKPADEGTDTKKPAKAAAKTTKPDTSTGA